MPKYKWSQRSLRKITQLHPDLMMILEKVINTVDVTVIEGYRGEQEQNTAFELGHSKLKFPQSKHNQSPSIAMDLQPYPHNAHRNFYYIAGTIMAIARQLYLEKKISHQLRWGGDWDRDNNFKDNNFNDLYHFELIKGD